MPQVKCKVKGCNTLTDGELCLYHQYKVKRCKHFYFEEMSIPVPWCDLHDERMHSKKWLCNNCDNFDHGLKFKGG